MNAQAVAGTSRRSMLLTMRTLTAMGCAAGLAACAGRGGSAGSPASSTTSPPGSSTSTTESEASPPTGADATETAAAPPPGATPTGSGLHGIIVATMPQLDDPASTSFPTLEAVDPSSGSVTGSREFAPSDKSVEFVNWYEATPDSRGSGNYMGLVIRRAFSTSYDKAAATKSNKGGTGNLRTIAGYIDESGSFHDMTATAPAVGDFDASMDFLPSFGTDNNFYFARKPESGTGNITTLFRVKDGSSTAETVDLKESSSTYVLQNDGTATGDTLPGHNHWFWDDKRGTECYDPDDMSSSNMCVRTDGSRLTTYSAPPYQATPSPSAIEERDLLPESSTRKVRTAVFSPDGTKIAFLAADSTGAKDPGGKALFDLYIVGVDGGEATKVAGAEQLTSRQILVEWRE